ncbi:MAG: hypothetical protein R2867_34185 [Caldilineaceae bacterium]
MTISKIEQLIGDRLSASAHTQRAWWSNRRTGASGPRRDGRRLLRLLQIDLAKETITFRKPPQIYQVERQGNIILWDAELVKALRHHMGLTQAEFAQAPDSTTDCKRVGDRDLRSAPRQLQVANHGSRTGWLPLRGDK